MESWTFVLTLLAGMLLGGALAWLVAKNRLAIELAALRERHLATQSRLSLLESETKEKERQFQTFIEEKIELQKNISELSTRLEEEKKAAQEKITLLEAAREQMKNEFENLANKIFEEKTKTFSIQSKTSLEFLINPFLEQLKDFGQKIQESYDKEARERISLGSEIMRLKELNEKINQDAINLTNALKGQTKTQGIWGEMILEKVLESSGLVKGREYETQESHKLEGKTYRPDVIVHLPEGKDIVIDSKVSLVAYERFVATENEEERQRALKQHILSLHAHIKGLAEKRYEELEGLQTLDYVLMFIPIEGAFMVAAENESELFSKAYANNIMIVSPSTLLVTLRTIHNIWRYEYQNQNAQQIAKKAGDLYDKLVGFVEDLEKVGEQLNKAQQSFESAHKKLTSGKGNVLVRAQSLRELGVKTKKALPLAQDEDQTD